MVDLPAGRQARTAQVRMTFFVYIIQSLKTGEFYKGLTNNIDRRLSDHLSGKSNWGKIKLPIRVVHVEMCSTRQEAREMEKYFKSGFGREIIRELVNQMM